MKRTLNIIFSLIFTLMLLVPLALTNTEEWAVSDVDGRTLARKPVFGSTDYTERVEKWISDRLGLRDAVINAYAVSNDVLFGELINKSYQYGKDGYTFYKIHSNEEFSDYHKEFAEMVSDMQKYCESRGTKFYYVFNPEKEKIYERYLPSGVNYSDEWADLMLDYMKELGVNCIDLRDPLTEQSYKEDVFNKKFEPGHWNHNGAFYGMKELTERMQKDIPGVKTLRKEEYTISVNTEEKLYGSNQIIYDEVPQYELKTGYVDITGDFAEELYRAKSFTTFQLAYNDSKEAAGIERMLLFRDDWYGPFVYSRSKETAAVNCCQNAIQFDYYYNIFKPDVVVFENKENILNDHYFSQEAMEKAEQSPAILKNFPEEDFVERRDALLEETQFLDTAIHADVVTGKAVDKVFMSGELRNTEYAYLITDSRVIDLKKDEEDNYSARVRHGDLPEGSEAVLYALKNDGSACYAVVPVIYVSKALTY